MILFFAIISGTIYLPTYCGTDASAPNEMKPEEDQHINTNTFKQTLEKH